MIDARPSDAVEVIFHSPWIDLSFSSCSSRIDSSTSSGLRPDQFVRIDTTGRSTSGVNWIGIALSAITPNNSTRMTPTATLTGLLMAKEII